jgi:predicted MFS family arabinose efflux permease
MTDQQCMRSYPGLKCSVPVPGNKSRRRAAHVRAYSAPEGYDKVTHGDLLDSARVATVLDAARQRRALQLRQFFRSTKAGDLSHTRGFSVVPFVFLPLACGYLLSYVFRTINGPLADQLMHRFSLDAGSLGLLTSVYFLGFSVSAIPIGVALDAFGPRAVQGCLMSIAAAGALIFALAPAAPALLLGRALIGIGVAGGLMAGLKAHALWIPRRLLPLANGGLMMFGGLGAIVATLPMGTIDSLFGWRGTFLILAGMSLLASLSVFLLVPRIPNAGMRQDRDAGGFLDAVGDHRFLRIAPLSASVVGTSFAVHGLWAARWFADVERLAPTQVLDGLLRMGAGLTVGSLAVGSAAVWLGRLGIRNTTIFGWFCTAFIAVQLAILVGIPTPHPILWALVGGFGGMAVLSYSILDSVFPASSVGRANSALNVLHLTAAWAVQAGMGQLIARWAMDPQGHYPVMAYRTAFAVPLAVQVASLIWFVLLGQHSSTRQVDPLLSEQTVEAK